MWQRFGKLITVTLLTIVCFGVANRKRSLKEYIKIRLAETSPRGGDACARVTCQAVEALQVGRHSADEWRALLGVDFSPTTYPGVVWTGSENGYATFEKIVPRINRDWTWN